MLLLQPSFWLQVKKKKKYIYIYIKNCTNWVNETVQKPISTDKLNFRHLFVATIAVLLRTSGRETGSWTA